MSFIVYLTEPDWTADDGGTLQLYPVEGQAQDSSKTFGVPTAHPTAEVRCLPPLQPVPQQRRRRCLPPSACQCAFGSAAAAVCCDILLWPRASVDLYLHARSLPLRVLLPLRLDALPQVLPKFNSMALFAVQPGRSYHSVQEVYADRTPRLSIQGWCATDSQLRVP